MAYYYTRIPKTHSFDTDSEEDEMVVAMQPHFRNHRPSVSEGTRRRRQRRNEREQQLNRDLSQLPEVRPLKPYIVHLINCFTSLVTLITLGDEVNLIHRFTIDLENDFPSNQPSLIQIECFDETKEETMILIFEMAHLPRPDALTYRSLRRLFHRLFRSSNRFYTWDNIKRDLVHFVRDDLLTIEMVESIATFDVQHHFKRWYNSRFPHLELCSIGMDRIEDHPSCDCPHRPYKSIDQKWSLQQAMAYTFQEFLDKQLRKSRWSNGLSEESDWDYHNITRNGQRTWAFDRRQQQREKLLKYAAFDCLSTTKLAKVVEEEWTRDQLEEFNRYQ